MSLTELCMYNNQFKFRDKFYKLKDGCAMGNPLSPFMANVFLAKFENEFSKHVLFPRTWLRYVDDIFAIVKRTKVRQVLKHINETKWKSLKFTMELEENGQIPFLDLLIQRKNDRIELGIYHKPTATKRYITSDSAHPMVHKKAAFNSMVHRLINIPLTNENFKVELQYIYETANTNGYQKSMVDQMVKKFKKDKLKRERTTLTPIQEIERKHWIVLPYSKEILKLSNALRSLGYKTVFQSGKNMQQYLGTTKDKILSNELSGVYQITCPTCNQFYIGQTSRQFITRFKEHQHDCNKPNLFVGSSAVAEHSQNFKHKFDIVSNAKILQVVNSKQNIDAFESYHIHKLSPQMNKDTGPLPSKLYDFV